ncbi:LacI family transcriptional regulator [Neorhizobium lilium]|uniref:LacI family transcriptional regulator n=2 Tax=Neorhizobium lilium TaxID=2503024 RepID=A0A3S3RPT8_9HYPH|nr:LacI family DNA-binding transcriptional regulator [Neorhizobium lilium]RWX74896.1 LacI family transcriptional regulator [Neorhizobium lilium]
MIWHGEDDDFIQWDKGASLTVRKPPEGKHERVTIRTVAAHAGVSVTAVSKVTRNAYGVSDALRRKVEESIACLGYRPSRAAQGLRGKTHTIGVLLIDIRNPFLPDVIGGINAIMAPADYRAMIGVGESRSQLETSLIESMIDYKMDGLVMVAPSLPADIISEYARQIPIVAIGYHDSSVKTFDTVNCNDQKGAALAVEAFEAHGYRDIGMLSLAAGHAHKVSVIRQREMGFKKAIRLAGLDERAIFKIALEAPDREKIMRDYINDPSRPRAVLCWSDLDAIKLYDIATDMGVKVPDELAIIGYDNSPTTSLRRIDLASIDQGGARLGELAAQTLLTRISGRKETVKLLNDPTLVSRSSLGV